MDLTHKSSDITTSTVLAAARSQSDLSSDSSHDARLASTSTAAAPGAPGATAAAPPTDRRRRGRLSRADQEHVLGKLLERAGMSPPASTSQLHGSSSHALPSTTTRLQRQRMPSTDSQPSTISSTSTSPSLPPLSPPSFARSRSSSRPDQHPQRSSTPPRGLPRTAGAVRIAQAIADTPKALRKRESSSSSLASSSSHGSRIGKYGDGSAPLSPADRRERDARRLSRLLEARNQGSAAHNSRSRAAAELSHSRSRTARFDQRTLLADASWEMEEEGEEEEENNIRQSATQHILPSQSYGASIRTTSLGAPVRDAAAAAPSAVMPSPTTIATRLASPPDVAMTELEAEYEALRQRLDDAKRRFAKWHGVVAVKVQEDQLERRRARSAQLAQAHLEDEKDAGQGLSQSDAPGGPDNDDELSSEHETSERNGDDSSEAAQVTSEHSVSASSSKAGPGTSCIDDEEDQSAASIPESLWPFKAPKILPSPKPVLGTAITLSLLWTCGYLITMLQWQMQHREFGPDYAGRGNAYSAADRRWMSEYYDPMYPELYAPDAAGLAGGPNSTPATSVGVSGALAGALRMLGGLST